MGAHHGGVEQVVLGTLERKRDSTVELGQHALSILRFPGDT